MRLSWSIIRLCLSFLCSCPTPTRSSTSDFPSDDTPVVTRRFLAVTRICLPISDPWHISIITCLLTSAESQLWNPQRCNSGIRSAVCLYAFKDVLKLPWLMHKSLSTRPKFQLGYFNCFNVDPDEVINACHLAISSCLTKLILDVVARFLFPAFAAAIAGHAQYAQLLTTNQFFLLKN